jgi:hypothetical protein
MSIFPGAVAVSGKEIEPIFFFTLDVRVAAQKISRSIRSRNGRGWPSSVNVASVVSVARSASRSPSLMAATRLGATGF